MFYCRNKVYKSVLVTGLFNLSKAKLSKNPVQNKQNAFTMLQPSKNTKEISISITLNVQLKKLNKICLPEAFATLEVVMSL